MAILELRPAFCPLFSFISIIYSVFRRRYGKPSVYELHINVKKSNVKNSKSNSIHSFFFFYLFYVKFLLNSWLAFLIFYIPNLTIWHENSFSAICIGVSCTSNSVLFDDDSDIPQFLFLFFPI